MNENWKIYKEYLNSCIARNEAVKNTTYRTYMNSMKLFIEYLKKYEGDKHYIRKSTATEKKSKLLEMRKKIGF